MEVLKVEDICKNYGDHKALDHVSLTIPKQSIFGLLGPNGAGKTTLIRIITQIINADSGEIIINGEKLQQKHTGIIGYLPEERGLYKKMKVGEQLLYLTQLKGMDRREAVQKIKIWLAKFEIEDWAKKNIEDLSKGMQQKIQFIATVIHEPELIILDEPFSGFDPINANLVKDEILELREKGSTIIFSTHRMESVEELCDDIALINNSKKILNGSKKEIKHNNKSNTYIVNHIGDILSLSNDFKLINTENLEGNMNRSNIKIVNGTSPNHLIQELVQKTEVHGFVEKIPSINDIFIAKVQEENHG